MKRCVAVLLRETETEWSFDKMVVRLQYLFSSYINSIETYLLYSMVARVSEGGCS